VLPARSVRQIGTFDEIEKAWSCGEDLCGGLG